MFVTRCDVCGKERGEQIAGWSKLSCYKRGNRPDLHVDLCPTCSLEVLTVLRIRSPQPDDQVGKSILDDD